MQIKKRRLLVLINKSTRPSHPFNVKKIFAILIKHSEALDPNKPPSVSGVKP